MPFSTRLLAEFPAYHIADPQSPMKTSGKPEMTPIVFDGYDVAMGKTAPLPSFWALREPWSWRVGAGAGRGVDGCACAKGVVIVIVFHENASRSKI
jgi:hypothetical protein